MIRGLRPGLGDLGCTIDRVGQRLAHIYPVGSEDLAGDLRQALQVRGAVPRHLGDHQVVDEGLDLGQDAFDVLVPHGGVDARDAREGEGGFHSRRVAAPAGLCAASTMIVGE